MKPGDKCIKIERGKYRYRGHIIYSDKRRRWWCCPDPSDMRVLHHTLRASRDYIDKWEQAFAEGRACGNIIGASEETLNELNDTIEAMNRILAE